MRVQKMMKISIIHVIDLPCTCWRDEIDIVNITSSRLSPAFGRAFNVNTMASCDMVVFMMTELRAAGF